MRKYQIGIFLLADILRQASLNNWIWWFHWTLKVVCIAPHRRCAMTNRDNESWCDRLRAITSMQNKNCGGSGLRLLYDNDTPLMGPKIEGVSPECFTNHENWWFQLEILLVFLSIKVCVSSIYSVRVFLLAEMPARKRR